MNEAELLRAVRLAFSRGSTRLFRNTVGVLQDNRGNYVSYGLGVGTSDLVGWKTHVITPADVGKQLAVFTALEVKGPKGRVSQEQQAFIATVLKAGGKAGVVWDLEDVHKILGD